MLGNHFKCDFLLEDWQTRALNVLVSSRNLKRLK